MKPAFKNIIMLCIMPLLCAFALSVVIYKLTNFPAPFTFFILVCILAVAFFLSPAAKRNYIRHAPSVTDPERTRRRPPE